MQQRASRVALVREIGIALQCLARVSLQRGAAAADHLCQYSRVYRTVAGCPDVFRGQRNRVAIVAGSDGGDDIIEGLLSVPAMLQLPGQVVYGVRVSSAAPESFPMVNEVRRRLTKKTDQRFARRLFDADVRERLRHIGHPGVAMLRPDLESLVRFPQAEPPAPRGVFGIAAQELRKKRRKRFDGAF